MVSGGLFRDRSAPLVRVGVHPSSTCRRRKTSPMSFVIGLGVVLACPGEEHHDEKGAYSIWRVTTRRGRGNLERATAIYRPAPPRPRLHPIPLRPTPSPLPSSHDHPGDRLVTPR